MDKYLKYIGKSDSCYTTYWIGFDKDDVIEELENNLKNLNKKIKDNFKRKQANDIIFNFKCYLENSKLEKINHIFLFNQEFIEEYPLNKNQLNIVNEWSLKRTYLNYEDHFKVDYLNKLFGDEKIYHILKVDNKIGCYNQITETKKKEIWEKDFSNKDEILEIKFDLVYGVSSNLKEFKNPIKKFLSNQEILDEIKTREMIENHQELEKIINYLTNPEWENKLVFGKKDISKSLQNCEIKTLFTSSKNLKKIEKSIDINFKVILIDKITSGDIGETFKKDYDGLLGIKYF